MEWRAEGPKQGAHPGHRDLNLYVEGEHTHTVWKVSSQCFGAFRILNDKSFKLDYRSRKYTFSKLSQAKRWCERDFRNGEWLASKALADTMEIVDG